MTNQSDKQQSVRDVTGTALNYEGDWHALFDADGIAAGSFNGRLLAWINQTLGASYTEINGAKNAFAVDQGFSSWDSMGTFSASSVMTRPADLRIVAKGGATATNLNTNAANYTRVERRSPFTLGGQPCNQIWVGVFGGYITQNGETNFGGSFDAGFALEYGGVTHPFIAEDTVSDVYQTVTAGSVKLWGIRASAFGLSEFPANMTGAIRSEANGTAGFDFGYPTAQYESGTGMACNGYTTGTSQLLGTGALTGGTAITATGFGPYGIFGTWSSTPDVSVMIFSDSLMMYKNDSQDNGTTGGGIATRALRSVNSRSVPHVKYSVDGMLLYQFTTSKTWWDFLASTSTHLIANPGGQDFLAAGKTPAECLANVGLMVGRFKSLAKGTKAAAYLSIQPATTGPFTTLDAQVPYAGSQAARDTVNTGFDGMVGTTLNEVIDTGRTGFEALNVRAEKVWKANYTNDGIHPVGSALTDGATLIGTAAASWS